MEKPFSCAFCFAKMRTLVGLKIHIGKVHLGGGRNKKVVAELSALPDRSMFEGIYNPSVCNICGFSCTSREILALHHKSVHSPDRRDAVIDRENTDMLSFATSVMARAEESIMGELPHLCCTDEFRRPVAVYVPIFLTEAESDLLVQLSYDRNDLAANQSQRRDIFNVQQRLSSVIDETSPAVGGPIHPETQMNLEPDPVDIKILNEVFEVVCNESELFDSPRPESRTFAVSEEMLEAIDLASDKAEVFEFAGDFEALVGRELHLHDFGDTIEFHVTEPDGSLTVMRAVRKMNAKLKSVSNPEEDAAPQSSSEFWSPYFTSSNF